MQLTDALADASQRSKQKKVIKPVKSAKPVSDKKAVKLITDLLAQYHMTFIYDEETFSVSWLDQTQRCSYLDLNILPFLASVIKNWNYVLNYLDVIFDSQDIKKSTSYFDFDFFRKYFDHIYHLYCVSLAFKIKDLDPIDVWSNLSSLCVLPFAPNLKDSVFPFLSNDALHSVYNKVTIKQAYSFFKPKIPMTLWRSFDNMAQIPLLTELPKPFSINGNSLMFPWELSDEWYSMRDNHSLIKVLKFLGLNTKQFKDGAPELLVQYALMVLNLLNVHPRLLIAVDSIEAEEAIDQLVGIIYALTTKSQVSKIEPYDILQLLRGYDRYKDEASAPDDLLKAIATSKLTIIPSFNEGYMESSKYEWFVYLLRYKCKPDQKCIVVYNCNSVEKISESIIFRGLARQYYEPIIQLLKRDFYLIGLPQRGVM